MFKSVRIVASASLLLLLAWSAPALSRQDPHDKNKEQEKPQKQDRPAEQHKQDAKPVKQDHLQAKRQQDRERPNQQSNGRQDARRQQQQDNSKKQEQQLARREQDHQRQAQQNRQDNSARQQRQEDSSNQRQQQQARIQQDQQQQRKQRQENTSNQRAERGRAQDQQQGNRRQQENRSTEQRSPAHARQQQAAWRGDRANSWQREHRSWQQRGGYRGYRIPDDRFRSYYGQDHGFRFDTLQVRYVGGHRRFQYGGYWFGLIDPWPEYWAADWYDNDDMYVDYYGDGYYLYNRRYPGDRIAISFYLR